MRSVTENSTHLEAFGHRAAEGQEGRSQLVIRKLDYICLNVIRKSFRDDRTILVREQYRR